MDWLYLFVIVFLAAGWLNAHLEKRKQVASVRQQETRVNLLHKAISAARAGVFYHNVKRGETIWDSNSLAMFGLSGEERVILPGTWESLLFPEDRADAIANMIDVLDGKTTIFSHSYRIVMPDKTVRWIQGSGYVLRDSFGLPAEISGFHFDITQQQLHERSLRQSESQALKAMEAKTQFLANMSHEIRTPMNAIIGMIDLLNSTKTSDKQRRYLATLHNSSDVLMRIIDDILDVSKIEAGKLTLEHKPFDLRAVVHQCLAVFTQLSDDKNLLLTGWIDPRIPRQVTGDSTRLQQILMNLIGNAFKFTEQGSVVLRVSMGDGQLQFSVADTGIGIEQEKIAGLFERFRQADDSTTRQFGGTGLGLAIVKEIVNLWGGQSRITSSLGKGSTFSFEIPCDAAAMEVNTQSTKFLLCTRFETLHQLWQEDASAPDVTWVSDVEGFNQALAQHSFEHVIVEQRFPGIHGSDLVQLAKQRQPGIKTTLIGFERYLRSNRDQLRADYFFARPFLVNLLWEPSFLVSTNGNSIQNQQPRPDFSQLNVLCVDDNTSNLMVLRGLLKQFKIKSDSADTGFKAIGMAQQKTYDLILMDYEMPEMDGPTATQRILSSQQVLVVGLSAHVGDYFEQQARRAGMGDFLRKPIKLAALQRLLENHFSTVSNAAKAPVADPVARGKQLR